MESAPSDDPVILAERLAMANVYIARSGRLLAEAKQMQDNAMVKAYEDNKESLTKVGNSLAQKILQAYCKESNFLVNWLDRINRGLVHSSDNLRTLISLAKENMRIGRYADEVSNTGNEFNQENYGGNW